MARKLKGRIVSVRDSGDLVTDLTATELAGVPTDDRTTIKCDGHVTIGLFTHNHQEPPMTLLAILEENGPLILTLVGDSASKFLGIAVGADVTIQW